jgi:hypothetical protein
VADILRVVSPEAQESTMNEKHDNQEKPNSGRELSDDQLEFVSGGALDACGPRLQPNAQEGLLPAVQKA